MTPKGHPDNPLTLEDLPFTAPETASYWVSIGGTRFRTPETHAGEVIDVELREPTSTRLLDIYRNLSTRGDPTADPHAWLTQRGIGALEFITFVETVITHHDQLAAEGTDPQDLQTGLIGIVFQAATEAAEQRARETD